MIETINTTMFKTKDGQTFGTLEAAQKHELTLFLCQCGLASGLSNDIAQHMMEHRVSLTALLTPDHLTPETPFWGLTPEESRIYQAICSSEEGLTRSNLVTKIGRFSGEAFCSLCQKGYIETPDFGASSRYRAVRPKVSKTPHTDLTPNELKIYLTIRDFDEQLGGVDDKTLRNLLGNPGSYSGCIQILRTKGYIKESNDRFYQIRAKQPTQVIKDRIMTLFAEAKGYLTDCQIYQKLGNVTGGEQETALKELENEGILTPNKTGSMWWKTTTATKGIEQILKEDGPLSFTQIYTKWHNSEKEPTAKDVLEFKALLHTLRVQQIILYNTVSDLYSHFCPITK